eukprot:m.484506 g.484506  ORF g.484506 m.484506 type:complete len:80 (+) comp69109_c0_seq1:21-260(+)
MPDCDSQRQATAQNPNSGVHECWELQNPNFENLFGVVRELSAESVPQTNGSALREVQPDAAAKTTVSGCAGLSLSELFP